MILQVLAANDGPMDADALAQKLALTAPDRFDALSKRLGAMLREGQLLQNRRGGYAPAERMDLIAGSVIANPDGFGFLRPDKGGGDDLFLPPFEMRKAMHGDRVLGSVTGVDRRGRREGAIVEVLERRISRLIGRYTLEAGISYVVPDDRRIQRNVMIPPDATLDAKHGQLVVAEIVQPADAQRPPIGKVLAVLGDKLTASLAVEAAIHGHEIPQQRVGRGEHTGREVHRIPHRNEKLLFDDIHHHVTENNLASEPATRAVAHTSGRTDRPPSRANPTIGEH